MKRTTLACLALLLLASLAALLFLTGCASLPAYVPVVPEDASFIHDLYLNEPLQFTLTDTEAELA